MTDAEKYREEGLEVLLAAGLRVVGDGSGPARRRVYGSPRFVMQA